MIVEKKLGILLAAIFILCAIDFLCTFVQPRYTARPLWIVRNDMTEIRVGGIRRILVRGCANR